jgi:hypothetical protein
MAQLRNLCPSEWKKQVTGAQACKNEGPMANFQIKSQPCFYRRRAVVGLNEVQVVDLIIDGASKRTELWIDRPNRIAEKK